MPFDNYSKSKQPYVKVTTQLSASTSSRASSRTTATASRSSRERNTDHVNYRSAGGSMYLGKLNSVWGQRLTTSFSASVQQQGRRRRGHLQRRDRASGPASRCIRSRRSPAGVPTGSGELVTMNNVESRSLAPSSMSIVRGDLTYYQDGWDGIARAEDRHLGGAAPAPRRHQPRASTTGSCSKRCGSSIPTNPAAGTVPFHRRFETPIEFQETAARDRDIGIYIQDGWKPHPRLTLNGGVRADFVRRFDDIYGVERMNSTNIGPRFGVAFLVTADARNVLRGSAGRVHEQVNGRDPITTFATDVEPLPPRHLRRQRRRHLRDRRSSRRRRPTRSTSSRSIPTCTSRSSTST